MSVCTLTCTGSTSIAVKFASVCLLRATYSPAADAAANSSNRKIHNPHLRGFGGSRSIFSDASSSFRSRILGLRLSSTWIPIASHSSSGFGRGTGFVAANCDILVSRQNFSSIPYSDTSTPARSANCQRPRMTNVTVNQTLPAEPKSPVSKRERTQIFTIAVPPWKDEARLWWKHRASAR